MAATWRGTAHGQGEVFRTTVFSKLLGLALIKFATLDPLGMGIEMEAGKPGWCDALNGLPGLFGSSMSETYELLRLLDFLLAARWREGWRHGELPVETGRSAAAGGRGAGRLSRRDR